MPPNFAAFDLKLSKAVDLAQGELLRFSPRTKGDNYGKAPDTDRAVVECVGVFVDGKSQESFTDGDWKQNSFNARVSGQTSHASVDKMQFATGNFPRKGDLVETISQVPIRRFEVVDVYQDGYSRLSFPLVPA
jgi:hypothetical protein